MQIRISLTYEVEDIAPGSTVDDVHDAADALADIMHVQAEDGLFPLGSEDGIMDGEPNDRVAHLRWTATAVEVTE